MKLLQAIFDTLFGTDSSSVYRYGPRPGQLWHEVGRKWTRTVEILDVQNGRAQVRTTETTAPRKTSRKSWVSVERFHGKSGGFAYGPSDFIPQQPDRTKHVPYWILLVALVIFMVSVDYLVFVVGGRHLVGLFVSWFGKA